MTSSDFGLPQSSPAAKSSPGSDSGLTKGAIAGISVGVVVASLLVIGAVAFFVLRGRRIQALDNGNQQDGRKFVAETLIYE